MRRSVACKVSERRLPAGLCGLAKNEACGWNKISICRRVPASFGYDQELPSSRSDRCWQLEGGAVLTRYFDRTDTPPHSAGKGEGATEAYPPSKATSLRPSAPSQCGEDCETPKEEQQKFIVDNGRDSMIAIP